VRVAVVAHRGKSFGGGLPELKRTLADEGVDDPLWYEVDKSRQAPAYVRKAVQAGAELVFVWGGDGMVQRCVDVLAGGDVPLAVLPAGTANLFATNLAVPDDLPEAVAVGLRGRRRPIDLGSFNGERFAVMAGVGYDAAMIRDAGGAGAKARLGRAAYLWSGSKNLRSQLFEATIVVDGATWFQGSASCVLFGNVSHLFGGVEVFPDVRLDDGKLDVGVVTAEGVLDWSRLLARVATGSAEKSPLTRTIQARSVKVKLSRKVRYELDGGDRSKVRTFKVKAKRRGIVVCLPD
jgi:YegS/Rv2252/BmrU family lipid kinase